MTMDATGGVKISGYCLIATGVFATLGFLIHPHDSTGQNQMMWMVGHLFIMAALFFNIIGLSGLYFSNSRQLGRLGLAGFLIAGFSLTLYIGKLYWSGFLYPLVVAAHPDFIEQIGVGPGSEPKHTTIIIVYFAGALTFAIGHAIFGASLLRKKIFQPAPVWFLIAGAAMVGLWPLLPNVVQTLSAVVSAIYAIGVVWLGVLLIRAEGPD